MVQTNLAFSADGAVANHVADGEASSLSDALNQLGLSGNPQVTLNENIYEQLLSVLSDSILDGILFLVGVVAIVLDLFHPTIVLSILGVIAIVAGLVGAESIGASWLGLVILALAAALIILELKLGHGFALIAGVILGAVGIYLLTFELPYSPSPITNIVVVELALLVAFGVLIGLYIRWIIKPLRRRTKMTGAETLIGKTGTAISDLKPKGEVRVEGEIWHAESLSGDIVNGEKVCVKALNGLVMKVEKIPIPEPLPDAS
jgi:membrane-bound serine protease (ClpP class)